MSSNTNSTKFRKRHAMGVIEAHATGAETVLVDLTPLYRIGQVNFGVQIQTHGAAVTPSFTMADADDAMKPALDAKVPWKAYTQIAASDIIMFPIGATVAKLVFAGAGTAYIGTL